MLPATHQDMTPSRRVRILTIVLLLMILCLAAGLRLLHLSQPCFWLDEVMTVNTVRQAVPSLTMSGTTPPLYYILMTYWMRLVTETEAMARLPSVLFGVLAVALLYWLVRRLFDRWAGLAAALLMTVSPFHIHYSQEARAYSLLVMLTLVSWLALIRVLDRESPLRLVIWAVTTALLLLSHNYAAFLVIAQVVFVLIWGRRHGIRLHRWLIGIGLLGLLSLPWIRVLLIMIDQLRNAQYWIQPPVAGDFVRLYRIMCSDSGWLMKINLLLVLAALAWWKCRFGKRPPEDGLECDNGMGQSLSLTAIPLLGSWLVLPVVMMITASWLLLPLYQHRYALALLPPFLVLVAWGAVGHGKRLPALLLLGLVICFTVPGLVDYYYGEPNRNPWREAAAVVSNLARPGDALLLTAPQVQEPFNYYYHGRKLPHRLLSRYPGHAKQVEQSVVNNAWKSKRIWVVIGHTNTGMLEEILDRRVGPPRLLERWEMQGIEIRCYRTDHFDPKAGPAIR